MTSQKIIYITCRVANLSDVSNNLSEMIELFDIPSMQMYILRVPQTYILNLKSKGYDHQKQCIGIYDWYIGQSELSDETI